MRAVRILRRATSQTSTAWMHRTMRATVLLRRSGLPTAVEIVAATEVAEAGAADVAAVVVAVAVRVAVAAVVLGAAVAEARVAGTAVVDIMGVAGGFNFFAAGGRGFCVVQRGLQPKGWGLFPRRLLRKGLGTPTLSQSAVPPPSTARAAPVMNDESSEARKSTALAISSAVPIRPIGRFSHPAR